MVGPMVGAAFIVTLQNTLATSGFPVTIATGVIFMACVLLFRRGIVGEIYARLLGGSKS
jgi:branched-chain amino acid transport system permease protein